MITLHVFGSGQNLPDPSPFVMKAEMLLKMSGQPYRSVRTDVRKAPKKKLPFITDGDKVVADTFFIRAYLERTYGLDFDEGLTADERAVSWAFEKMLEEHLYFAVLYDRWVIDENFARGPAKFFERIPALMRSFIVSMVRKQIRQSIYAQGIGRHSWPEIVEIVTRDIDSLAILLGDKPFMMGDRITALDAIALPCAAGLLTPTYSDSPLQAIARKHPKLIAYRDRMMKAYFPDFA